MTRFKQDDIVETGRGIAQVKRVEVDEHDIEYLDLFFGDNLSGFCFKRDGNWTGWGNALADDASLYTRRLTMIEQQRLGLLAQKSLLFNRGHDSLTRVIPLVGDRTAIT